MWLCYFSTIFCFSSSSYGVYLCVIDSNGQNISDQILKIKSMIIVCYIIEIMGILVTILILNT